MIRLVNNNVKVLFESRVAECRRSEDFRRGFRKNYIAW